MTTYLYAINSEDEGAMLSLTREEDFAEGRMSDAFPEELVSFLEEHDIYELSDGFFEFDGTMTNADVEAILAEHGEFQRSAEFEAFLLS